jgi:Sodium:dicarboxylate symporter family
LQPADFLYDAMPLAYVLIRNLRACLFALILPLAARMGASAVGAFGYYVIAICGLLCVQTLALYPIAAVVGRVPAKRFAQAVFPAQAIAFSSSSSLASLPALLEGAEKKLERPPELMGFVLPLAVRRLRQARFPRMRAGHRPQRRVHLQTRLWHGQLGVRRSAHPAIGLRYGFHLQAIHRRQRQDVFRRRCATNKINTIRVAIISAHLTSNARPGLIADGARRICGRRRWLRTSPLAAGERYRYARNTRSSALTSSAASAIIFWHSSTDRFRRTSAPPDARLRLS